MKHNPGNQPVSNSHPAGAEQNGLLLNAAGKPISKEGLKAYLLDSNEVLELLHICRTTLYNWRKKKWISFSKIGGRIYFEVADVYQMLKRCKQPVKSVRA